MTPEDRPDEDRTPPGPREFDRYAAGYDAGMEVGLKRLMGADGEAYITVKVRWLLRNLSARPPGSLGPGEPPRLLDFGCGAGTFLKSLRTCGFEGRLCGCDVSAGMLDRAREHLSRWPDIRLDRLDGSRVDHPDQSFDLVVVCAVLHHIPVLERPAWYSEFARVLKPGGRLVVFEHNPLNPVTLWVVRRTEIDRNAVLLRASEVEQSLAAAGLARVRTEYLLFFPPRLRVLGPLERLLAPVPLGGQFATTADRP